jgi:hypothetical protein
MCDRHGLALAYEVTVAGPGVAPNGGGAGNHLFRLRSDVKFTSRGELPRGHARHGDRVFCLTGFVENVADLRRELFK